MIVAFDLETTGLNNKHDEIIEVALVKFDEKTFETIDTYSTFINPGKDIPELISNITNIFNDDVVDAPYIDEVKNEIVSFIGDCPVLGHNVHFDRDFFIENNIDISNNIYLDTFFLANMLCFQEKSLNLEMLCKSFGVPFSGAHRALNDVNATIALFQKLSEKFQKLSAEKKELLKYIFTLSEDRNIDYLGDYLGFLDIKDIEFKHFEAKILKKVGKIPEIKEVVKDSKLKIKKFGDIYSGFGNVEKRENQLKMTELIFEGLQKKKHNLIEAPTGLGKSFAYLIPSIVHSVKKGEKVFISTKTKTLQDQLFEKDLSFLHENIGFDFNYTKLKGKSNYVSIKYFFDEIILDKLDYKKVNFLSKVILWIFETKSGELDELNYFGSEFTYVKTINSESTSVLRDSNIYRDYEFLYKARSSLNNSNIIVINHSLLFSDLKGESSLFGKIQNLIVDEAHSIEDSVTDSLKKKITEKSLVDTFNFIENILSKKNVKKIDFLRYKETILSHMDLIMDYSYSYVHAKVSVDHQYKNVLMQDDFYGETDFKSLLSKVEISFLDVVDFLSIISEYDFSKEIIFLNLYLESVKVLLKKDSSSEYIKVIQYHERFGVSLEYTLLNPGNYLTDHLWKKIKSVTLTSATLKVNDSFDYFKNILSLGDFDFYSFESDFDYKKQATLFLPTDLGSIKNNSNAIVNFLNSFYALVAGKTLTLLTSFSIIKKIYTSCNLPLKKKGITLYAQSIGGSKTKLLSFYMDDPENSILLGTDSFWEGVDIKGENLKYLVIHKFPFPVPTDPIFQARSVFFEDAFMEYSVPKAIIKLKQGFGRLIRSKNDTGIVILLDDRIHSTRWGQVFYDAFPQDINIKKGRSTHFLEIIKKSIEK